MVRGERHPGTPVRSINSSPQAKLQTGGPSKTPRVPGRGTCLSRKASYQPCFPGQSRSDRADDNLSSLVNRKRRGAAWVGTGWSHWLTRRPSREGPQSPGPEGYELVTWAPALLGEFFCSLLPRTGCGDPGVRQVGGQIVWQASARHGSASVSLSTGGGRGPCFPTCVPWDAGDGWR